MRVRHHCVAAFAFLICATLPATAETRLFLVANNSDGYGVDRCLATGAPCGRAIASAYCRSREFHSAVSYRRLERDDITGAIPVGSAACKGNNCEALVAIECSR